MTSLQHPHNKFLCNIIGKVTANPDHHTNHLKMNLDPCRYCPYVGDNQSTTSSHIHTNHPGKDCTNHFCWTCGLMFRKENTLKRHNTTVKHLLEAKGIKKATENLQQTTTLWSTTNPEVRYLSYIDHIDQEYCAPQPTHRPTTTIQMLRQSPITIPLEKKGYTSDPRPGHGIYKKIKILTPDSPAAYATEDTPDNPPFIIENMDKSLSYVPDHVAEDLFNNLTTFLNTCDQNKTPVELKIASQEDYLHTPSPPDLTDEANNNFVDLTIDSWLTIDIIGTTPAVEAVCPTEILDFLEEL